MRLSLRHKQSHLVVDIHREGDTHRVVLDGKDYTVEAHALDGNAGTLVVDGRCYRVAVARNGKERLVAVGGEVYTFVAESGAAATVATVASPDVVAPMPGKVLQVLVRAGDRVEPGDGLLLLEAMKMESRLTAEAAGTVTEIRVAAGDMVGGGQVLVVLAYDDRA